MGALKELDNLKLPRADDAPEVRRLRLRINELARQKFEVEREIGEIDFPDSQTPAARRSILESEAARLLDGEEAKLEVAAREDLSAKRAGLVRLKRVLEAAHELGGRQLQIATRAAAPGACAPLAKPFRELAVQARALLKDYVELRAQMWAITTHLWREGMSCQELVPTLTQVGFDGIESDTDCKMALQQFDLFLDGR